jgi:DNA-3-methyladenine glycosylase II
LIEARATVRPPWPFRLGGGSADGVMRRRGASLQRLLHHHGEPVLVAAAQGAPDRVVLGARAASPAAAGWGIERLRFALCVDDDLRAFHDAFRDDAVIGRAVRSFPYLRVRRRPVAWEALAWAVTEQLIEFERAVGIQRRLVARLGPRCPATGLRDVPAPAAVAGAAPAALTALDLAPARALTLRRAAALAARRPDLGAQAVLRALRAIPGVGRWTLEMLALFGLGRYDRVPAADVGYLKIVGRLLTGNPRARADEAEVRGFFDRYGAWKGLAGEYLRVAAAHGLLGAPAQSSPAGSGSRPSPGRNSFVNGARPAPGERSSSLLSNIQRA